MPPQEQNAAQQHADAFDREMQPTLDRKDAPAVQQAQPMTGVDDRGFQQQAPTYQAAEPHALPATFEPQQQQQQQHQPFYQQQAPLQQASQPGPQQHQPVGSTTEYHAMMAAAPAPGAGMTMPPPQPAAPYQESGARPPQPAAGAYSHVPAAKGWNPMEDEEKPLLASQHPAAGPNPSTSAAPPATAPGAKEGFAGKAEQTAKTVGKYAEKGTAGACHGLGNIARSAKNALLTRAQPKPASSGAPTAGGAPIGDGAARPDPQQKPSMLNKIAGAGATAFGKIEQAAVEMERAVVPPHLQQQQQQAAMRQNDPPTAV